MNENELKRTVERVSTALSALGVPFHITGGLASSYYGEPRTTRDADFVVRLSWAQGRELLEALAGAFLVESQSTRTAIETEGLFQALDEETLIKVDFHVGERIPGELGRSVVREILPGLETRLVSKEDAILSKLIWVREGSARSRNDVIGMLLDPTPFDLEAVQGRSRKLGCDLLLEELRREAFGTGDSEPD